MKKSEGLKYLEQLANDKKKVMHPTIPAHALPRVTYSDANTNDLQTCIVDYLDLIGGWGVRVNVMGVYVEKLGRHIPSNTKKGTPDILGCLPKNGIFIGLECKQPGESLREDQEKQRRHIIQAGGRHLIAYVGRFQEVYEQINNINNIVVTISKITARTRDPALAPEES